MEREAELNSDFALKIINESAINIFGIENNKLLLLRLINELTFIKIFKDFVLLFDFIGDTYAFTFNDNYENIINNYYIIHKELLYNLINYKNNLEMVVERIKYEYMCCHTGKLIRKELKFDEFDINKINDEYNNIQYSRVYKTWKLIRDQIIKKG